MLPKAFPQSEVRAVAALLTRFILKAERRGRKPKAILPLIVKPGVGIPDVQQKKLPSCWFGQQGQGFKPKIPFVSSRENAFKSFGKILSTPVENPEQLMCLMKACQRLGSDNFI